MLRTVVVAVVIAVACRPAKADITIPVTSGSTPTCLGRLYSDILIPSGWGPVSDTTAATRFAQSNEGTLGFTIFFEVRPVTGWNTTDTATSETMNSIGFTALNRNSVTGFISSHITGVRAITKNMSAVWVNTNDGSGDLQTTQKNALPGILNSSPQSANCTGLIYSLEMGQNITQKYPDAVDGNPPANNFTVSNWAPRDLWFNSTGNSPSSNAYQISAFTVPRSGGTTASWYFFGQNGVSLKQGYSWF